MTNEERLKLFDLGDKTKFNTEDEDESVLSAPEYRVVGITNDKVKISHKGNEKEVSPFELYTTKELEQAVKERQDEFHKALGL
jgi:hypothetical protein